MEELDNNQELEPTLIIETPQKKGMAPMAFQYGLMTAIALIALTVIIYFANLQTVKWVSWIGYLILLAGIYIGTRAYRDELRGGFITYGGALGFGTLSVVFAAIVSSIFVYIFYKFLAPDAMGPIREAAETQMLQVNPNMSDQEYDMAMKFVSPGFIAISSIFGYILVGFVLSLITSAILKKDDPMAA